MTKSELYKVLINRMPHLSVSKREMEIMVDLIFETMRYALARGERIEIRGFGNFKPIKRKARKGRNPKTGKPVDIPPRNIPFFKCGKDLLERINKSQSSPIPVLNRPRRNREAR